MAIAGTSPSLVGNTSSNSWGFPASHDANFSGNDLIGFTVVRE